MLNPQKVYYIDAGQHVIDLVRNFDAKFFKLARHERARADQSDARAELEQAENVRTRDSAEQNIADDCNAQTGDFSSPPADRVKVEKGLRWMLVRSAACIYHRRLRPICEKLCR